MRPEADVDSYVQDLEKHLQMTLFDGMADPEGAVLLVRGALADGDQARAVALAKQTQRLAAMTPGDPDMAAAADRARGLVERDPAALQRAAGRYAPGLARAGALEDAGNSWAGRGDQDRAHDLLSQAYALYEELGDADDLARVRVRPAGRGHPATPLEPRGPAGLRLGQPDRHRAARHRPGGAGAQQPAGGEPGIPEHAHRRVPPAPHLLEARHHLPGPAGADRRGAGRRGCLVAVSPAGSREAVAGVGPERVPHG
jgi:hypothetical protein